MTEPLPNLSKPFPVFPLPGLILFPHTHLPLHIFENRYRNLLEDTLRKPESAHWFAIGTEVQEMVDGAIGLPPVYPFVGIGRITEYQRMPDGRLMMAMKGIGRAKLGLEHTLLNGYRTFDGEWLPEIEPQTDQKIADSLARDIKGLAVALLRDQAERFRTLVHQEIPLGHLCDMICGYLPLEPDFKLRMIRTASVIQRATAIISELEKMVSMPRSKPLGIDEPPSFN